MGNRYGDKQIDTWVVVVVVSRWTAKRMVYILEKGKYIFYNGTSIFKSITRARK